MVEPITEKIHEFLGVNNFLFVMLICFCLVTSSLLTRYRVAKITSATTNIILGFIFGSLAHLTSSIETRYIFFKPEFFFYTLLPPIMFEAGFNLQKKSFFKNLGTILLFSILGTILNTLIIGTGLCISTKMSLTPLETCVEGFILGSLLSAVDTVGILSLLNSKCIETNTTVFSVIFGESLLNDSISILLFKSFEYYAVNSLLNVETAKQHYFVHFFSALLGALSVGVLFGLLCSFALKKLRERLSPPQELAVLVLAAYGSYCAAEIIQISGAVTIFFLGVTMSNYALPHLSSPIKISANHVFKTFSILAETFVFAYLGICFALYVFQNNQKWSFLLILITSILCIIARFFSIIVCSLISKTIFYHAFNYKAQFIMFLSGVRGAVSFSLSLNISKTFSPYFIKGKSHNGDYIVSTTIFIVLLTNFTCGGLIDYFTRRLIENDRPEGFEQVDKSENSINSRESWMAKAFEYADAKFLNPIFGENKDEFIQIKCDEIE